MAADRVTAATAPIQTALEAFIAHLAHERRASPRTLESYRANLSAYLAFLQRHRGGALTTGDLVTITAAELRAFLAFRRGGEPLPGLALKPLSPRSVSQTLSSIRSFTASPTGASAWPTPRSPSCAAPACDPIRPARSPKTRPSTSSPSPATARPHLGKLCATRRC